MWLQLRAAMQLSLALGRQLVLPQLWCGPDPSWDQHHGFTPPNDTHNTAMPCPLGAVIDIPKYATFPLGAHETDTYCQSQSACTVAASNDCRDL